MIYKHCEMSEFTHLILNQGQTVSGSNKRPISTKASSLNKEIHKGDGWNETSLTDRDKDK